MNDSRILCKLIEKGDVCYFSLLIDNKNYIEVFEELVNLDVDLRKANIESKLNFKSLYSELFYCFFDKGYVDFFRIFYGKFGSFFRFKEESVNIIEFLLQKLVAISIGYNHSRITRKVFSIPDELALKEHKEQKEKIFQFLKVINLDYYVAKESDGINFLGNINEDLLGFFETLVTYNKTCQTKT